MQPEFHSEIFSKWQFLIQFSLKRVGWRCKFYDYSKRKYCRASISRIYKQYLLCLFPALLVKKVQVKLLLCVFLATTFNDNFFGCSARPRAIAFNLFNDVHPFYDLAEDNVSSVQPFRLGGADEKLGAVRVGAGIGHRKNARASVLQLEVLIPELGAVNGLAAGSVEICKVAALAHKLGDHAMEDGPLIAESLLSSAQRAKVFGGFWYDIASQFHRYATKLLPIGGQIKVHPW